MGFFDFLFAGGAQSQLKKHIKRLTNLNAQMEERMASAQWLSEYGQGETEDAPQAIVGLLKRFGLTYEKQMKDLEEKEFIVRQVRRIGVKAVDPLKAWMRQNEQFAYPIQILEELSDSESTVDFLLEMLGEEIDPFKTEKKRQIILHLGNYENDIIVSRVAACLRDYDEGVRYAAVETLAKQNPQLTRNPLVEALGNLEEESNRLRIRLAEITVQHDWSLGELSEDIASAPPYGWTVQNQRMVVLNT